MLTAGLLLLALTGSVAGQISYPMITHVSPVAVQRGQATDVVVEGQMNFHGVSQALFQGSGIKAEILDKPVPRPAAGPLPLVKSIKLKLTVDADAALGVRELRLASPLGLSSVGQLLIVDAPVIQEAGNNNTLAQANPLPIPGVACGKIEVAEDVDYFKFRAEAGQTFSFEVWGARLEDKIHDLQKHLDPMITLFDAEGRELAASDDFYFADPQFSYTFTKAGDYFIQVRDSKYDGDPRWVYALLATDKPSVTHIYPMGGKPGQMMTVEPIGSARLKRERLTFQAPATPGIHTIPLDIDGSRTFPVTVVVSDLPPVQEQEPNDTPAQANRITLPCLINGRIDKPRDVDHFVFQAAKGKALRFEVKARRFGTPLQSSLDSVIDILNDKGAVLASSDDVNGKDAALVFPVPADGDYYLRIRDLNSKGGPTAVYCIEAEEARPDFTVLCDGDKAMLAPGTRTAWFLKLTRLHGFIGPVTVEVRDLPAGVTASPLTIPATMTQGVIVLSAAANAKVTATNIEVVATGKVMIDGKEQTLTRLVQPQQEIYFPGGGRGVFPVVLQSVAVTQATDIIKLDVQPMEIRLKPGQEVRIEVTLERHAEYTKGISLDVLFRHLGQVFGNPLPPGVTLVEGKSKTLLGAGSKGHLVLKAAPNAAPIEGVPICVLAHVSVNFVVKMTYASPAILVTIEK